MGQHLILDLLLGMNYHLILLGKVQHLIQNQILDLLHQLILGLILGMSLEMVQRLSLGMLHDLILLHQGTL